MNSNHDKLSLTVVILTKEEELHIARVIRNVAPIASRIIVVDSISADRTVEIARTEGAEVVAMPWRGNQAAQFNHALDTIAFDTDWILRLDADEYLEDALIEEMRTVLPTLAPDITAGIIPLGRCFMGRRLKHGIVNSVKIIRLFRPGAVRYEQRQMDEHLNILHGRVHRFRNRFVDDNLQPLSQFIAKHDAYALREAAVMLDEKYNLSTKASNDDGEHLSADVAAKRRQKSRYGRMPRFWRAGAYFFYRYIIRLGFLDGKEGFLWDYLQGWWYRTLVDAKLLEIERACGSDPDAIRRHLAAHGIKFE